jgi:hypothetical protein
LLVLALRNAQTLFGAPCNGGDAGLIDWDAIEDRNPRTGHASVLARKTRSATTLNMDGRLRTPDHPKFSENARSGLAARKMWGLNFGPGVVFRNLIRCF